MRLVLHNPHIYWFKPSIENVIRQTKAPDKYEYLLDYLYRRDTVYVYIDDSFSLTQYSPKAEFLLWAMVNRLDLRKFAIVDSLDSLESDDVLLTFVYENFANLSGRFVVPRNRLIDGLKTTKAYKAVHLSHFGYNASLGARNTEEAKIDLFVSESNLARNSAFFRHYYSWYEKDVYVLPFVAKEKFRKTKEFANRKNKALATGTITFPMKDADFTSFFHHDRLQPIRHEILESVNELEPYLDSIVGYIAGYPGETEVLAGPSEVAPVRREKGLKHALRKIRLLVWMKRVVFTPVPAFQNAWGWMRQTVTILKALRRGNPKVPRGDRAYYHMDIVDRYNDYKMFIVSEEAIGLPGIGFVEGMACGSAYVGLRDSMYGDLGMLDGVHYIGYDGTMADLVRKIAYYQEHGVELERIAEAGYRLVLERLNAEKVAGDFVATLSRAVRERLR